MIKLVSGAQTGVDRAALDAAQAAGVAAGGWCPEGRLAEDGTIPDHYPVTELPGAGYLQRTRQNVIDSDATLIIHFGPLTGGTRRTHEFCIEQQRPCLLIDASERAPEQAVDSIDEFIRAQDIQTLNVAGPRASGEPGAYAYARQLLTLLLDQLAAP